MKWIKKFNESRFAEFDNILNDVKDMCIDFGDLGLDYKVMVKNINSHEKVKLTEIGINPVNIKFYKYILIEITDTSHGFKTDREEFNSILSRIKDYIESQGNIFLVSRYDENENYYLNDTGYTTFDEYLKDQGNFYGFEIRIILN
jgi:hypothetical protein